MKYYTIKPSKSLTDYVRYFWVLEDEVTSGKPYIHRSMADGCAEFIFHYNGVFDELITGNSTEKSFTSGLVGQSQIFRRFLIKQNFGIFGVYLYPYSVSQLFSIQGNDLKNQMLDLKTLIGIEATELEEKMMSAADNYLRTKIITEFLENRLTKTKLMQPGVFEAIKYIVQTNGTTNVEDLAKRNFLSTRQLKEILNCFLVLAPNYFHE